MVDEVKEMGVRSICVGRHSCDYKSCSHWGYHQYIDECDDKCTYSKQGVTACIPISLEHYINIESMAVHFANLWEAEIIVNN